MQLTVKLLSRVKTGQTKPWREAATLIVATTAKTGSSYSDLEYLVTQRSPKSKFYPNAICFPGGTVSPADSSPQWFTLFQEAGINLNSLSFLHSKAFRPPIYGEASCAADTISKEIVLRLTAIRETFEESGVLVCKPLHDKASIPLNHDTELISKWQKRVKDKPESFLSLCKDLCLLPDLEGLIEWSNWLTPTGFSPRYRFDTMFYVAMLKVSPQVVIDHEEVVRAFTGSAQELLELAKDEGKFGLLPPPQIYELTRMKDINMTTFTKLAKLRQTKGIERWCPLIMKSKSGAVSLLPGDDLYPRMRNLEKHLDMVTDSSFAELTASTKNYHRMYAHSEPNREVVVNIPPLYGNVYSVPST